MSSLTGSQKAEEDMPKFKLIALTTPVPGKEKGFHAWYQDKHLPKYTALFSGFGERVRAKS
jgi:hypothetical protein